MSNAFCVVPSNDPYNVQETYAAYYENSERIKVIEVARRGQPALYFFIYKLSGWKNNLPEIK